MTLPSLNNLPAVAPVKKLTNKKQLQETIWESHGILTIICAKLNLTYHQCHNAIKKWGLEEDLRQAKEALISEAEQAIFDALHSKSESIRMKAAELVMRTCQPRQGAEVIIKNGDAETTVKAIFGIS